MNVKTRFNLTLPKALVLCCSPLLGVSASGAPITFNEYSGTNTWTLPSGTNLLAGATASGAVNAQYGSSSNWTTLTDGSVGPTPNASTPYQSAMNTIMVPTANNEVTFALDLTGHPDGYTITAFDSYGLWNDPGRDDQRYTLYYSTDNVNFTQLTTVQNNTPNPGSSKSTHTRVTDDTGVLATNVKAIRVKFTAQENGGAGYSEFVLTDATVAPLAVRTLNEANGTNVWALPAGTNLLDAAAVASPPPPSVPSPGVATAGDWAAMTDGLLGSPNSPMSTCTPFAGYSVVFPMKDLGTNSKGYDLTSLDFYCAWADAGRDDMDITVSYSTYSDPSTFIPLHFVANHTPGPGNLATHTRLFPASGFLATNVAAIKLDFPSQENGWVGYREFIALGTASPLTEPLTWTGANGSGGNATWTAGTANNWTALYDVNSPLFFTQTGTNRNISVPSAIAASSITFSQDNSPAYAFGGQKISVTNSITSSGAGAATFAVATKASTGLALTGAGSMTFNADVESPGLIVSGSGSITLNADNDDGGVPLFTGTASVSNGTLNVAHNLAIASATLSMSGGSANFTTAAPSIARLSGTGGTVNLGNTELTVGLSSTSAQTSSFAGNISQASGTGKLTKIDDSTLILSGSNTYTGTTRVSGGRLQLAQRQSLYGGNTALWTTGNIVVDGSVTLGFNVGSAGEFTDGDLNALGLGGFAAGSRFGINATGDFTLTRNIGCAADLYKDGPATLTLTGANNYTGVTTISAGTIKAANPSGVSLPGDVYLGDGSNNPVYLSMGADNQFSPNSVLHVANITFNGSNGKVQLRGTNQAIAGLESPGDAFVSIVQNDDLTVPDYVANPSLPPASLTINTAESTSYSFRGIIRNETGPALSLIKNGPGIQELINNPIQGYGYTGPTTVNGGTLKLNFSGGNSGFASDVTVNAGATLEFDGTFTFARSISGAGQVVKSGFSTVTLGSAANSYTGDTTVLSGTLAVNGNSIPNASKLILNGGLLSIPADANEVVGSLYFEGVQQGPGTYGSTTSSATFKDDNRFAGTGIVTVPGPTVSYEAWAAVAIANPADRDRTDDPDGDGFLNLDEFLFGTSPVGATGSLTAAERSGTTLVIRWNEHSGNSYVLQESSTLAVPWNTSAVIPSNAADQSGLPEGYVRKQAIIAIDNTKKFVRVLGTE